MVGVVGSSPIAPTKFGSKKALSGNAKCFFIVLQTAKLQSTKTHEEARDGARVAGFFSG